MIFKGKNIKYLRFKKGEVRMFTEMKIEQENLQLSETGIEFFLTRGSEKGQCTAAAHLHNAIEFLYITRGAFLVYVNGEKYTAHCGDLVLFRSNTGHTVFVESPNGGEYAVLKMKPSVLLDMASNDRGMLYVLPFAFCQEGQKPVFRSAEVRGSGMEPILLEMLSFLEAPPYAAELAVKANAVRLCAVLLNGFEKERTETTIKELPFSSLRQIYQAMTYIHNHFDRNITARECALQVNMSYSYFSRLFKQVAGKRFTAFLTEVRITHAEKELLLSERTVTEICYRCGFNDVSYFIAKYRALRGVSPYRFRKNR